MEHASISQRPSHSRSQPKHVTLCREPAAVAAMEADQNVVRWGVEVPLVLHRPAAFPRKALGPVRLMWLPIAEEDADGACRASGMSD